jgi:FlaA1/EpsC-like NDP-sugar epimerase
VNYKIDRDTVVLILGGTGSVGSMLVEKFLALDVKKIKVIARDESKQSELIVNNNSDKIEPIIGDIRDIDSMEDAMKGVDVVVNAAAMKHVWYCENFPEEAYKTNVLGTINLVRLCKRMKIKKLILISSDKVVNPTTAYGASKLMAERVILAAHKRDQSNDFNIVRFGNVIGSRNSVLDLVSKAINTNNKISMPPDDITRFVMTKSEAANLVIDAIENSSGGQIFLADMPVVNILSFVETFVTFYTDKLSIDRNKLSYKPHAVGSNEKHDESLLTSSEYDRAYRLTPKLITVGLAEKNDDQQPLGGEFKISSRDGVVLSTQQMIGVIKKANL